MSTTDSLTDIDWPSSFYSTDESSLESTHNPYYTEPPHTTRDTTNDTHPAPTTITLHGQQPITRWLTSTTPATTNQTAPPTPHLTTIKLKQIRRKRSHIQVPLHELLANQHWGDLPSSDPAIFRVLSKNVNSLSTKDHNLQWRGAIQAMIDLDAHVICLQEPNTNWTDNLIQPIYRLFQKAFMHAKLVYSASIDKPQTTHQPSGTFMAITGCYAARVLTTGTDNTGLGRWSYSELTGRNGRRFILISAYRVGEQQPVLGSHTAYTQQYHILLQHGHNNPNPRELFIHDIIEFVRRWQPTHDILLCLDANDTAIHSKDHGIDRILEATNLIDLHRFKFPTLPTPATHQRGSKTIDYCLGSRGFANALKGAWMLPFGMPCTLTGDHRTIGLEFDHDILFGQKIPNNEHTSKRGVYSNAYPTVRKFNDDVAAECARQRLFQAAQTLSNKDTFSQPKHNELERIDAALTAILIKTDQKYAKHRTSPWSPELHQAFLGHCYWRTKLTQTRTKRSYKHVLQHIAAQMTTAPATTGSDSQNLRLAQQ